MFASNSASTRPAKPSHELWTPLPYMTRAVEHLLQSSAAVLWLDPGMRKTSITLAAFLDVQEKEPGTTMLVIAPLRVCRLVWRQEGQKWTQFRHLKFALLHGAKKDEALRTKADIYLINPEGITWLAKKFAGRPLPYDIVCFDEITKFKNSQSERSKAIRPRIKRASRRWGLTGTPNPNGYLDLFGQFLVIDDGTALERFYTHYRDLYFQPDFNGFDYALQPGGAERIHGRIDPYVFSLSADDYLDLPPLVADPRLIEMSTSARALYKKMKNDMIAELPTGTVTAANSAAVYSKLSQMANGAVYFGGDASGPREVAHVHDAKLDALEELIEELDGKQLLVAYEFKHDLARILQRLGEKTPVLGNGVSAREEELILKRWNAGEIPVLLAHPASVGHGLNLQESNACHVCWFSMTWDLELFDQFNRRLKRSGNAASRIMMHLLMVKDTIDELKLAALNDKDATQQRLRSSLNTILRDGDAGSAYSETKETTMGMKLSRQGAATEEDDTDAPRPKLVPKGWGKPAATADESEDEDGEEVQKAAIKSKIAPKAAEPEEDEEETEEAPKKSLFSKSTSAKLAGKVEEPVDEEEEPVPKKLTATKPKQLDIEDAVRDKLEANKQAMTRPEAKVLEGQLNTTTYPWRDDPFVDFHVPVPKSKYPAVLAAIAKVLAS